LLAGFGVAAVESADADGEDQIIRFLVRQQEEGLRRDLADAHRPELICLAAVTRAWALARAIGRWQTCPVTRQHGPVEDLETNVAATPVAEGSEYRLSQRTQPV
jgi:hypothetical protein